MTTRILASMLPSALAAITVACAGTRGGDDRTAPPADEPVPQTVTPLGDQPPGDADVVPSPPIENGTPDDVPQAAHGAEPVDIAQLPRDAGIGGGRARPDAATGGVDAGVPDAGTIGGDAGIGGGIGGGDASARGATPPTSPR